MNVLTTHSFKAESGATVHVTKRPGSKVSVRFKGLGVRPVGYDGKEYVLDLTAKEAEAMQTLMNGGWLDETPEFKAGDIVRAERSAGVTQPGALAIVQDPPHHESWGKRMVNVKWIDDRANSTRDSDARQNDGSYYSVGFKVVEESELTSEDYQSIGRHELDRLSSV